MTYAEAIAYIDSVEWKGSRPGLERIGELCERLGHPERSTRYIHVAGTNGKGSVCASLDSILRAAGYRVGLYTSPYVLRFNDRIRFGGADIPDEELAAATAAVKACADRMADGPTAFELITAIAFVYYARAGCDCVVLECGMGGRLDSTNVIDSPVLDVITGIDLDHCAVLGDTTAAIAGEKAGILRPGVPCLYGECDESAAAVIRARAEALGAPCRQTDFAAVSDVQPGLDGTAFRFRGRPWRTALPGVHQARNAATVLTAVELLRGAGFRIPDEAVERGLAAVRWPARFETLRRDPVIVYDGAHNPQGVAAAAENIRALLSPLAPDGKVGLVMGVMADKDRSHMLERLAPLAAFAVTVRYDIDRALSAEALAEAWRAFGVDAQAAPSPEEGLTLAARRAAREGRPLICLGSLYLYGQLRRAAEELA